MIRTTAPSRMLAGGLIAATLAGCSGTSDDAASSGSSTSASASQAASFNDADVSFAQAMIPHHAGAIKMAQLAEGRAQDSRVLDLAKRIEAAQGPEIKTLTGWLEDWGQPTAASMSGNMGGMDMGQGSSMDTSMLESASGTEFDRMFLQMMIEHHTSAVDMAETEVANGKNADAKALAQSIVDSQTAQIKEMQTLLAEIGS